jgi:hypothetical protein
MLIVFKEFYAAECFRILNDINKRYKPRGHKNNWILAKGNKSFKTNNLKQYEYSETWIR